MCSRLDPYRTPELLQPIQLLDLLELCGNTAGAARAAGLSQPTVSRRTRQLLRELNLKASKPAGPPQLRYGDNACLQLLRQAAQLHRLEAGAWRLSGSSWSIALLEANLRGGIAPVQFRHPRSWQALVSARILDAALVSGLDLNQALADPTDPLQGAIAWDDCRLQPLAAEALGLLLPKDTAAEAPPPWSLVAVPAQPLAPGLGALTRQHHWQCLHAPKSCQSPEAWAIWLAEQGRPALATPRWCRRLQRHLPSWSWWPLPSTHREYHWLLLRQSSWDHYLPLKTLAEQWRADITQTNAQAESGL